MSTSIPGQGDEDVMASTPLFGETRPRDRLINYIIALVTGILVVFTFISAFIFPESSLKALGVFFSVCITLVCVENLFLIQWYRQGDLDTKFRMMIYFNTLCILLFCICANCYYHLSY